jgi:hypothetical protein
MSVTDEVLKADEAYVRGFNLGQLPMPPARKLAILSCMDARLTVEQFCGLKTGDAHIIRNAGGIATEDALRSLIISHRLRHADLQGRGLAQATGGQDRGTPRRTVTIPYIWQPGGERTSAGGTHKVASLAPRAHPGARLRLRREDGTIARSGGGGSAESRLAEAAVGSGKRFPLRPGHGGLVVLRINDHIAAQAFALALGGQPGLIAQRQVDDAALAR